MLQTILQRTEFDGLEWVVQTNYGREQGNWESMAAFNHKQVATTYADECKATNPSYGYRVIELSPIQPTHAVIYTARESDDA